MLSRRQGYSYSEGSDNEDSDSEGSGHEECDNKGTGYDAETMSTRNMLSVQCHHTINILQHFPMKYFFLKLIPHQIVNDITTWNKPLPT